MSMTYVVENEASSISKITKGERLGMANVRIIGKKGSQSRKDISANTAVKLYTGQRNIDAIVNYGLAGQKLLDFFKKYPSAKRIPMINKNIGHSKYFVIKKAEEHNIKVPDSLMSLPKTAKLPGK